MVLFLTRNEIQYFAMYLLLLVKLMNLSVTDTVSALKNAKREPPLTESSLLSKNHQANYRISRSNSTRRFLARPATVSLVSIGLVSP